MLGGYAPLPLRLQPGALDGISAEQYLRLCADLAAARRVEPIGHLLISVSTAGPFHVIAWASFRGPSAGLPSWLHSAFDGVTLTLTVLGPWTDDLGVPRPVVLTGAEVSYAGSVGLAMPRATVAPDGGSLTVTAQGTVAVAAYQVLISLYAKDAPDPREYGGDDDKANCVSESSATPLAAELLEQIQLARGSSYTTQPGTLVAAENLALARGLAWQRRQTEKALVQRDPAHASDALPYWRPLLGINPSLPDWEARKQGGSKWTQAMRGPGTIINQDGLDAALREHFGSLFVATHHAADSFSFGEWLPETPEWWALSMAAMDTRWNANCGHWSPDLGAAIVGPWTSQRLHTIVELTRPAGMSEATWRPKIVEVDSIMDVLTPAWNTWETCTGFGLGFRLDYDRLDDAGLS